MVPEYEVVLINMPFGNLLSPSIGLGLLKGALTRDGIPSKTFHFGLRFAELIGYENYTRIYSRTHSEHLAGEFIFSPSLFGEQRCADIEQYVRDVLNHRAGGSTDNLSYSEAGLENLKNIIALAWGKVEDFLQECLESIVTLQPRVVGFTSLFHQHIASLCLARLIKQHLPDTFIVFGGSNCEGPMGVETFRQFEFLDAIVSGEGELVFPEIVRRVLNSETVPHLEGVFCRRRFELPIVNQSPGNTQTIENLDALPLPNYDEYFEQLGESSLEFSSKPRLLFETSRGCWWGEKQHCTFCGLNGDTMVYRSKSAERAFSEFLYLTEKYPGCSVNVVDNILDMKYFKDFIPMLAERKHGFNLFYEVKANLKKDQLRLLREAGIGEIQPGIESFSDNVLRTMRKGVSSLQNIQIIKWCKELGLKAYYNLIWGFPGERADDYLEMVKIIPLITHLQPPMGEGTIRIDRFSPNFEQGELLGFSNLFPHPAYRHVYPFAPEVLSNLAYFFNAEKSTNSKISESIKALVDEVKRWKDCHRKSDLFWIGNDTHLLLWDFRPIARERLTVLTGYEKFAYMVCDQIMTTRQVFDLWRSYSANTLINQIDVRAALDSFVERDLMVKQEDSYLALAYAKLMEEAKAEL